MNAEPTGGDHDELIEATRRRQLSFGDDRCGLDAESSVPGSVSQQIAAAAAATRRGRNADSNPQHL